MASILLSFVGHQDPFSNKPHKNEIHIEGSIITLARYLIEKNFEIKKVVLVHTDSFAQHAIDTQEWLSDLLPEIESQLVELRETQQALSLDPIDSLLAVKEARSALDSIHSSQDPQDTLEFNASSGTPAMKNAWNLLQAAGYASNSRVWQVRNPSEQTPDQERVFCTDVSFLRQEFERKVIKQQILDYNYDGALSTLKLSSLFCEPVEALLMYGHFRLCFDFNKAYDAIKNSSKLEEKKVSGFGDIAFLRQQDMKTILREAYYGALIKLKNKRYSDFLVMLFSLQENVIRHLLRERLGLNLSYKYYDTERDWKAIKDFDNGILYRFLESYQLSGNRSLRIKEALNRVVQIAILEHYSQFELILQPIRELDKYCEARNNSVHELVGVSFINDEATVISNLRKMIKQVCNTPEISPFDELNQEIIGQLNAPAL